MNAFWSALGVAIGNFVFFGALVYKNWRLALIQGILAGAITFVIVSVFT